MSNVIEQKILEMRFDNKQFEDNVNQSINTLEKLRESLDFDGVERNFDALSDASNSIDFSSLNNKLTSVGEHISHVFKEIGIGALREFGASLERDVISKIKELTFGQFNEGWTKYNQKVESVQTIMAATGKTIDDVSTQLERLNWFSDETSYSFTDMTSNVAKFTGAGVELEEAVTAMQGISTWAALAGQNASTASRAMYNLSQAMGMGYVGLADWKSIELANMATSEFKEVLLDTAAAMGTLQKYSDGTYQAIKADGKAIDVTVENMRSTLNEKWLTKDVLMETLQAYGNFATELSVVCDDIGISAADFMTALSVYDGTVESVSKACESAGVSAQALLPHLNKLSGAEYELGRRAFIAAQEAKTLKDAIEATKDAVSTQWMNTFEYLFGNYEEAKEFFTEVTNMLWDMFATSGDIRNTILEQWSEVGGEIFRSGLLNVLEGITNIVGFIREIITDTLGITRRVIDENGEVIVSTSAFAEKLLETTKKFGEWSQKFADFTSDLSSNLNIGDEFYVGLAKTFDTLGEALGLVWSVVKNLSPLFRDLFNVLQKGFEFVLRFGVITILDFINVIIEFIKQNEIIERVIGKIVNTLGPLLALAESGIITAHKFILEITRVVSESKLFHNILEGISLLFVPLIEKARTFFSLFSKKLKLPEFNYDFGKIFDLKKIQEFSDKIVPLFEKVKDSISVFYDTLSDIFSDVVANLAEIKRKITEVLGPVAEILASVFTTAGKVIIVSFVASLITLTTAIIALVSIVAVVIQKIKDFISLFKGEISLSQFFDLHDILDKIKNKIAPITENFKTLFDTLKKNLENTSFGDKIIPVLEKISGLFSTVSNKVKEFFSGVDKKSELNTFVSFNDILDKIKEKLSYVGNLFVTLKENIKNLDLETTLSNIYEKITKLGNFIWETLTNVDYKTIGEKIVETFHNAIEKIKNLFSNIDFSEAVGNIKTSLSKAFENFNLSDVFDYLTRAVTLFGGFNLGKLFGSVSDVISNGQAEGGVIGSITSTLTDMFGGLTESLGGFTSKTDDSKLMSIAKGIGIVTVALLFLASVDSDKIGEVLLGVGAAFGGAFFSAKGMSLFDDVAIKNMQKAGWGLIEIAGAIWIIVDALKPLADMDWTQIGKMGGALTVILVEIMIFINNFAKKNAENDASGNAQKAAFALVEIAVAMKIMISALKSISELNGTDYGQAIAAFVVITGGLILAEKEADKIKHPESLSRVGAAALLLSLAVDLIVPGLKSIARLNGTDFTQSMLAFVIITQGLIDAERSAAKIKHPERLAQVGAAALLLSLAVDLLVPALKSIARLNGTDYAQAIGAFTLIMLEIGVLFGVLSDSSFNVAGMVEVSAAILLLATSMNVLVPALTAFALLPWKSFGYFTALMASMLAFGAIAGFIAPISVGLYAIGAALFEIGAGVALVGTGVALIGFGLMEIASALVLINIAGILHSIASLGNGIAELLRQLDITLLIANLKLFMAALPEMIAGFIAGIINMAKTTLYRIKDFIIDLIDLFAEMVPELVKSLTNFVVESLTAFADSLPEIIPTLMDIIFKILDAIIENLPTLIDKFAVIICQIFDGLTAHIPEIVTSAMKFLGSLFDEILKAADAASPDAILKIIETIGMVDALIISANLIGTKISASTFAAIAKMGLVFAEFVGIVGIIESVLGLVNKIPGFQDNIERGGELLGAIGSGIGKFIGGIVNGIKGNKTDELPSAGKNVSGFMEKLSPFFEAVKNVDENTIKSVESLSKVMLTLTASEFLQAITGWFKGKTNTGDVDSIEQFGISLEKFGPHIKKFGDSIAGLNTDEIISASDAIVKVAETFDNNVFKTGGVVQWFKGENADLQKFGTKLNEFAPLIKSYAETIKGLVPDDVIPASKAIVELTEVFDNNVFKTGGVVQWFKGENGIKDFGKALKSLGPSIKFYAESVVGIKVNDVKNSAKAIKEIAKVSEELPEKSTLDRIFKINIVQEFADSLNLLGTSLRDFYDKVAIISSTKILTMIDTTRHLFELISGASGITFKIDKGFKTAMQELADSGISEFVSSFATSVTEVKDSGLEFMESFADGLGLSSESLKETFEEMFSYCMEKFKESYNEFRKSGRTLMENFALGITDTLRIVKAAVNTILTAITELVTSDKLLAAFRSAGSDIMVKFMFGILSEIISVATAAEAVGLAVLREFTKEEYLTAIKEAGAGVMKEFKDGMNSQAEEVQQAARKIASDARTSIEGELAALHASVQSYIDDNFNFQPVITPVYDDSELQRQMNDTRQQLEVYAAQQYLDNNASRNAAYDAYQNGGSYQNGGNYNTNSTTVYNPTFNINGATDPKDVASTVNRSLGDLFRQNMYAYSRWG